MDEPKITNALLTCVFFLLFELSANLGGNFGLFLGMSILTVLEFVEFSFRRICFLICKKTVKTHKKIDQL